MTTNVIDLNARRQAAGKGIQVRQAGIGDWQAASIRQVGKLIAQALHDRGDDVTVHDMARMIRHGEALVRQGQPPQLACYLAINFRRLIGGPALEPKP